MRNAFTLVLWLACCRATSGCPEVSTDFKMTGKVGSEVPTAQKSVAINPNAGREVYKVTPRPYKWVWNNDLAPYIMQDGILNSINQGETKGRVELNPMNNNFVPWRIYD